MSRFHKGRDGWGRDSYSIPQYAVLGSSHCGSSPDSPAPTDAVKAELNAFRKVLKDAGIGSHWSSSQSGNLFMQKIWVVVTPANFQRAGVLALQYEKDHRDDTHYIHNADLDLLPEFNPYMCKPHAVFAQLCDSSWVAVTRCANKHAAEQAHRIMCDKKTFREKYRASEVRAI